MLSPGSPRSLLHGPHLDLRHVGRAHRLVTPLVCPLTPTTLPHLPTAACSLNISPREDPDGRPQSRLRQKRGSRCRLSTSDKTLESRYKSRDKGTKPLELTGTAKCGQPRRPWSGMMTLISAFPCCRCSD